jgi:hypothetical protein
VIRNCKKGEISLRLNGTFMNPGKDFRYGFVPTETSYLPFLEYGDERWSVKEIIPQSLLK